MDGGCTGIPFGASVSIGIVVRSDVPAPAISESTDKDSKYEKRLRLVILTPSTFRATISALAGIGSFFVSFHLHVALFADWSVGRWFIKPIKQPSILIPRHTTVIRVDWANGHNQIFEFLAWHAQLHQDCDCLCKFLSAGRFFQAKSLFRSRFCRRAARCSSSCFVILISFDTWLRFRP